MNANFVFGLSISVISSPLTGYDPSRICSCHFTVRLAAHICNMGIIIILGISFMRGIYTYIPEANNVPREHYVATILM